MVFVYMVHKQPPLDVEKGRFLCMEILWFSRLGGASNHGTDDLGQFCTTIPSEGRPKHQLMTLTFGKLVPTEMLPHT